MADSAGGPPVQGAGGAARGGRGGGGQGRSGRGGGGAEGAIGGGRGRGGGRGFGRARRGPPVCLHCREQFESREALQEHLNNSGHRNKKPDGSDAAQRVSIPGAPREGGGQREGGGGRAPRVPNANQIQGQRPERTPACRVCKEVFQSKEALLAHLDASGHRGGGRQRPASCFFCKEEFADRAALLNHLEVSGHKNKRPEGEERKKADGAPAAAEKKAAE